MHQNRCLTSEADGAFDLGLYFRNYDILCLDGLDLFCSNGIKIVFQQPGRLVHLRLLQQITDIPAVAEIALLASYFKRSCQLGQRLFLKANALPAAHHLGNLAKLICIIIREGNMESNTGTQTGILLEELLHLIGIAGKDHHHILTMVFHLLDDGVDSFVAKGTAAIINQRIFVRAISATNAKMDALTQARQQFGPGAGAVTIVSVKEV